MKTKESNEEPSKQAQEKAEDKHIKGTCRDSGTSHKGQGFELQAEMKAADSTDRQDQKRNSEHRRAHTAKSTESCKKNTSHTPRKAHGHHLPAIVKKEELALE